VFAPDGTHAKFAISPAVSYKVPCKAMPMTLWQSLICNFCSAISGDMDSPLDRTLQQLESNAGTRKFGHVMYSDDAPLLEGVPAAESPDAVFTQGRGVLVSMLWNIIVQIYKYACLGNVLSANQKNTPDPGLACL